MWSFFKKKKAGNIIFGQLRTVLLSLWAYIGLWIGVIAPFFAWLWPGTNLFNDMLPPDILWFYYSLVGLVAFLLHALLTTLTTEKSKSTESMYSKYRDEALAEMEIIYFRDIIEANFIQEWKEGVTKQLNDLSETEKVLEAVKERSSYLKAATGDSQAVLNHVYMISDTLREALKISDNVAIQVKSSLTTMSNVSNLINENNKFTEAIQSFYIRSTQEMETLQNQIKEIDKVVTGINGINRQSNILAINASIEAARMGEAGRTFAIVASEVQALAKNTSDFTAQIQAAAKSIKEISHQVVKHMNEAASLVTRQHETLPVAEQLMVTVSEMASDSDQAIKKQQIQLHVLHEKTGIALEKLDELSDLTTTNAKFLNTIESDILNLAESVLFIVHNLHEQVELLQNFLVSSE
ncbi:methyl-accepting chemotaxis protein [Heliorestis convoluta]|uniref:Methyl-accepting chemotaxis protein n=1 Tax=Heliorestis convoluta TaxID=356322 RepID=A0A5Q2MXB2_9FIRM|nr:methyl-accepting chemotaxis protein [Heliorestis convoluta]QGG46451.1 methyl-accepting chemotaxis protein [Heliorestis convoluta]